MLELAGISPPISFFERRVYVKNTVYIVNDISLSVSSPIEEAYSIASSRLRLAHISLRDVTFSVYRKSVDARKKKDVRLV